MLLAGDAVHLFTPTGGFGLNTGVEESANLSWKLAAADPGLGRRAPAGDLESERKPIAVRKAAVAREMGKAWHDLAVTAAIEQDSPAGAAERASAAQSPFVLENHFVRPEDRDWLGVVLGARYDNSPVVVPDGPPPADETRALHPFKRPGRPGAASVARQQPVCGEFAVRPSRALFHAAPPARRAGRYGPP